MIPAVHSHPAPCICARTGALAAGLCSVAASRAGSAGPVTVEERPLAEIVADAIGALKLRAGVELLDRKMATLRQDISERAASAAKDFKVRFIMVGEVVVVGVGLVMSRTIVGQVGYVTKVGICSEFLPTIISVGGVMLRASLRIDSGDGSRRNILNH